MKKIKTWVGVDVAKRAIDVFDGEQARRVPQNPTALRKWASTLHPSAHVVMEATGGYERPVVEALREAGIAVSVVNPRQVRDFAKATGQLAKTDKLDAAVLAHFGRAIEPPILLSRSEDEEKLKALLDRRRQLVESRTAEKNRRKLAHPATHQSLDEHIDWLGGRIEAIDKEIDRLTSECASLEKACRRLRTAPGVGRIVALTLVAHLPELGKVNRKQIAGLVGLAPYANDSGGSHRQRRIWGGRAEVRSMLYIAAYGAVRASGPLRTFFLRLVAGGKAKKPAYAAVARKPVTVLNAMMRDSQTWGPKPSCC